MESSQEKYHLLKCLAHASLAEKVDPLFSSVMVQGPEYIPESVFWKNRYGQFSAPQGHWFADGAIAAQCSSFADKDARKKLGFVDDIFPDGKIGSDISRVLEVCPCSCWEQANSRKLKEKTSGKGKGHGRILPESGSLCSGFRKS